MTKTTAKPRSAKLLLTVVVTSVALSACTINVHGPWFNEEGVQMQSSEIVEFDGPALCEWQKVVFLQFFGDQYTKDSFSKLGELTSLDGRGRVLTFERLEAPPEGSYGTGIHHEAREIWINDEDRADYIYINHGGAFTERWPRFEERCDPDGLRG